MLRPAVNQLIKIGTRGSNWNSDKYIYDVITRAATFSGTQSILKAKLFSYDVKIDILKSFYRATTRTLYGYIGEIIYD